ncbi:hypothetical protein GCM10009779_08120 [Polymorphospora rubra]|uniref:Uncharacterized protein n=1 Tax=Polymorphospora rubra TaxID=338584 RepID=A0A810N9J4_9ACTN|nr:hypothetical protein Prubr_67510 [Polymorphospora rubra]
MTRGQVADELTAWAGVAMAVPAAAMTTASCAAVAARRSLVVDSRERSVRRDWRIDSLPWMMLAAMIA